MRNMVITKNYPAGRSSSCLRKYRLLFTFGVTVLCVQIYLAHTFFGLDNGKSKSSRLSSGEVIFVKSFILKAMYNHKRIYFITPSVISFSSQGGSSQPEEGEGLPKGLRQLKLPPDKQTSRQTDKQTSTNKQTLQFQRNRTARIKLDYKTLNFIPMCEITGREAVSAVTRAQSQACKQRIVNVTCLNQQGSLYPKRVQSVCPHSPGFTGMPTSLGCFKDDKALRILSSYYHIFKGNNSPERCAYMCLQSGYPYAGTEYSLVSL